MTEEAELKLLDLWASPFGMRCRIALAEKGVEYEYVEQNVLEKSELLLSLNPIHKKVPVLLHAGKPLCESLVILQYIEEVWPHKYPLLPSDPYARAHARFWADFIDKKLYESGTRLWKSKGEVQREWKEELIEILKTLVAELGNKRFFGGDAFGLVDIVLVPLTTWFYTYEFYGGLSIEKECPELVAWLQRCAARESVARTLHDPKKIRDFVRDVRKTLGLE